ncbi:uncharacterized protein [Littorina saxatilis]|uniref:Transmembrane protein n=1 Tax=Littorina saxatilis TaxID=31220 RepID=A0AAN9BIB8_9CAEN
MEIQGVNTTRNDLFPFSALRVLGSLQIFTGSVCIILGIVDLAVMLLSYEEQTSHYAVLPEQKKAFETMVDMTVSSAPIWCGTWYLVTGSLGACVSRSRSHSLKFLKIAFLVLSVLCSAFFAPACTVISCFVAVTRHTLDYSNLMWLVSTATAFLSLCEMGVAIISASVCCCCSPLSLAKVHILFADSEATKPPMPRLPPIRKQKEDFLSIREQQPVVYRVPVREAMVQTDPPKPQPRPLPPTSHPVQSPRRQRRLADPRYPVMQRPSPEPEYRYPEPPRTSGSYSYDQLRKWALPHGRLY